MPKLRAVVNFPQAIKGRWSIESPPGSKVFEQPYEGITSVSTELSITPFSAYILVNGGISTSTGTERVSSQSVYVTVTPGTSTELKNTFHEKPTVTTASGVSVGLYNKFRTKVSVSVS